MQALSDDLAEGAMEAAEYIFGSGDEARRLRGRRAVYRMTENGLLPVIRMGRKLFYRKSDLDRAFRAASS